ncbi:vacuolar protein sorting protein 62 [Apiospora marii]|uniref:vacuolar protein sorting protein 62 n=1 Tax=Apiospora marii TaxID=335849 RepID=UPI0031320C86
MITLRRVTIAFVAFAALIAVVTYLPRALNPVKPSKEQTEQNKAWIDTSPYWLDRQACRWLSLCGVLHIHSDPAALRNTTDDDPDMGELRSIELRSLPDFDYDPKLQNTFAGHAPPVRPKSNLKEIPDYVLKFAPLVHLYSGENFWPSDIAEHVRHMSPYVNDTHANMSRTVTLDSMHGLDAEQGFVYLKSNDDVESRPEWLHSHANIPSPFPEDEDDGEDDTLSAPEHDESNIGPGESTTWYEVDRKHPLRRISDPRKRQGLFGQRDRGVPRWSRRDSSSVPSTPQYKPDESGRSKAPATLVLVDKGSGIVDAFWFFFYAYNLGQTVLGMRFGNHVGDWEHCMIRFEHGMPRGVFFSEHEGGQAYAWHAVEKRQNATSQVQRPVIYSAVGSHAMYATPGDHPYVLPFNLLKDQTDRGPLWDPARNIRSYWYDYTKEGEEDDTLGLEPTKENPEASTNWFHYGGPWGDKLYGLDDTRQYRLFGQYHYVTGPTGPKHKNLGREKMCILWRCKIIHSLTEGKKGSWHS